MEGLLPFMIILITTSLSSNTYNKASWWEELTFEGIKSTLSKSLIIPRDCSRFWIVWEDQRTSRVDEQVVLFFLRLWFVFSRTATIRSQTLSAGISSSLNPACKGRFRILLSGAKLMFASYTSNWLKRTCDLRKCTMFHLMKILNPEDLLPNLSLETVPACIVLQY